jgi:hypothetical protein
MHIKVSKRSTRTVVHTINIESDQVEEIVKEWAKVNLGVSDNAEFYLQNDIMGFEGIEILDSVTEDDDDLL